MGGCGHHVVICLLLQVPPSPADEQICKLQSSLLQQLSGGDTQSPEIGSPQQGAELLKSYFTNLGCRPFAVIIDNWTDDSFQTDLLLPKALLDSCHSESRWLVVTSRQPSLLSALLGPGTSSCIPVGCSLHTSTLGTLAAQHRQFCVAHGGRACLHVASLVCGYSCTRLGDFGNSTRESATY